MDGHLEIAVVFLASLVVGLTGCASSPVEETASQSSKAETLDCLPLSFSFCDWKEVGHPEKVQRRAVVGYQIWGEKDENGNCDYTGGMDLAKVRDAMLNGEPPPITNISYFESELCGFEVDTCGIITDDAGEGLPRVYGKCIEK